MKRVFRRSILFVSVLVIAFSTFASTFLASQPVQAATDTITDPSVKLEDQVKRWLYYRGMRACLEDGLLYNDSLSRDDVQSGHWDINDDKEGFGYFAPDMDGANDNDGTVECSDGSIWVRGATLFGFDDPVALFCELNRDGAGDKITPNDKDCEKSTSFEIDSGGGKDNWQPALTKALDKSGKRPAFQITDNPNQSSMYYLIGERSTEIFCGSGVLLKDGLSDLHNDSNRVSVDVVDTSTGEVQKSKTYFLKGDRDEDSKVDDIYYNKDGNDNEAIDKRCHEMAAMTRDHSAAYQTYLIEDYNDQVGEYFKGAFKATKGLKKATFDAAVDKCKTDASLVKPMPVTGGSNNQDRMSAMKKCLKDALPAKYDKAIDAITDPDVEEKSDQTVAGDDGKTTCAIDGIGWIICPVMTFLTKLNDAAFGFLNNFLVVPPGVFSDPSTKGAWETFRNIANILFVIAFLVIIYSQITGAGISNYGLKKLLPKLILSAILVNVSFYICEILVDLSNIIGSNLYGYLANLGVGGTDEGSSKLATIWQDAGAIVLAAGAIIGLIALVLFAPVSLLAFAVVIFILIARQAFVVLLIVISPLAFVAYLLPNTEQWFKRWWSAITAVLMVFPIIALVFGASTLASNILNNVSADCKSAPSTSVDECKNQSGGEGDDEQTLKIVAAGVLAVPLFAVPVLLKGSMAAAGSVGGKIAGLQDKANSRAARSVKEGRLGEAKGAFDARRNLRRMNRRRGDGRLAQWGASRKADGKRGGAALEWIGSRQKAFDESGAGRYLGGDRGAASAVAGIHHDWDENVKNQKALLSSKTNEELLAILRDKQGSTEYQAAAAGLVMSRDHRDSHLEALRIAGKRGQEGDSEIGDIQKQMSADMKDKPFALGDQAAGQLGVGQYGKPVTTQNPDGTTSTSQLGDLNGEFKDRLAKKLSASSLASMNPDELKLAHKMATAGELNPDQLGNLQKAINDAAKDPRLKVLIKPEAANLHADILAASPAAPPTSPPATGP